MNICHSVLLILVNLERRRRDKFDNVIIINVNEIRALFDF